MTVPSFDYPKPPRSNLPSPLGLPDAEQYVEGLCSSRSAHLAELSRKKESLVEALRTLEKEAQAVNEELRVSNELMEILVQHRMRQEKAENVAKERTQGAREETAHEQYAREFGMDTVGMPGRNH